MGNVDNTLKQPHLFRDHGQILNVDEANMLQRPRGLPISTRPDKGDGAPRTSCLLASFEKAIERLWAA